MQLKNKKRRNISFVIAFFVISVLILVFNFVMDPYEAREKNFQEQNYMKFDILPKEIVYPYLNRTTSIKYDIAVLGSSCIMKIFFPVSIASYTEKRVASLIYPSVCTKEMYFLLEHFLNIHPEVEQVYIALDMNTWFGGYSDGSLSSFERSKGLKDFFHLYYSVDVFKLSLNKFKKVFSPQKQTKKEQGYIVNKKRKYEYAHIASEYKKQLNENVFYLKKMKHLLDSKNIHNVFVISPVHALFLSYFYRLDIFYFVEDMKKEIAQITPFYDMAYINRHTIEPFEYFWNDVTHPTEHINKAIYSILIDKNKNEELAVIVNSDNIEEILMKQRILISKYVKENLELLDQYISEDLTYERSFQYDEVRKEPNIPKDYR